MNKYFKKKHYDGLDFENVFFDSKNTAGMDTQQMQGVIERPISKWALFAVAALFIIILSIFSTKLYQIQVVQGSELYEASVGNAQKYQVLFNKRGIIYDRNGVELVWNEFKDGQDFANRRYIETPGFAHLLGYVTYPQQDDKGKYFQTEYQGVSGLEYSYNEVLNGQLGFREIQVDTFGNIISDSTVQEGIDGLNLYTTIDVRLQEYLHRELARFVEEQKFVGASGIIMDVHTGEILAMTNVPEYDSNILADGDDRETIAGYNTDESKPFLNRALGGSYAPGSAVKPFIAAGILDKDLVDPNYRLVTNGTLVVPNRFGGPPTYFRDARNNGVVNIQTALAKSSNIYFFTFGGGFEEHSGLGIYGMKDYLDMFGFGEKTGIAEFSELSGFVPDPQWKQQTFGEEWLLGDTYYTAIGQYSFLATPLQLVTAAGAIATDGLLLSPQLVLGPNGSVAPRIRRHIDISQEDFQEIQEGMRKTTTHEQGTARSLNLSFVTVAAKTGTAERGVNNSQWNSWTIGYWPYEEPKYAFVVMAENGPAGNRIPISRAMSRFLTALNTDGITDYFE